MDRKILISALLGAAITASSCSTAPLTFEQMAIVDALQQNNPQVESVTFSLLKQIDSATLGQELDRREKLFETKIEVETGFIRKYGNAGMPANKQKHMDERKQAKKILKGIRELGKNLEDSMDSVIYRTYIFSCKGNFVGGGNFACDKKYINITSDGKACNMSSKDERHKNMGFTIPGYSALLGSFSE